jgi:CRISPR-associated RAMP protein (TIGR02581 family)
MFRKSLNRAVLRVRVDTETPLLIRAGDAGLDPTASDLTPVRTEHGRHGHTVYIPGSSFKGVLRAAAEARVRGVRLGPPSTPAPVQGACDPLSVGTRCGGQRRRERRETAELHAEHCLACRLFGSLAVRGRAAVRDLFPWDPDASSDEHTPTGGNRQRANQLEQRFGVSIDRITGSARPGGLFDQEMVPAGVSFWGEIALQNYQVWQLGLLAQALDAVSFGAAQLGSSKSRGLGSARVTVEVLVHEQVATAADRPRGAGALLDGEEARAYGLLVEGTLPDATAERRGLAARFTVGGAAVAAWLDAGRAALGGLLP